MDHCVVMTTCPDEGEARSLARLLLERSLAACVQLRQIESLYAWEGEIHEDPEILLFIKTRADLYPEVEVAIQEHHSYDVPEIIMVPITRGSASYLGWIDQVTRAGKGG